MPGGAQLKDGGPQPRRARESEGVMEKQSHSCLSCGEPANPELKFCPTCEYHLGFNLLDDEFWKKSAMMQPHSWILHKDISPRSRREKV